MTQYTIRERFIKDGVAGFHDICFTRSYTLARIVQWILTKIAGKFIVVSWPAEMPKWSGECHCPDCWNYSGCDAQCNRRIGKDLLDHLRYVAHTKNGENDD